MSTFCQECGHDLTTGRTLCANCGTPIDNQASEPPVVPSGPRDTPPGETPAGIRHDPTEAQPTQNMDAVREPFRPPTPTSVKPTPEPTAAMLGEPGPASHPPTAQAPKTTAMAPAEVGEGAGAAGAELGDGDAKSGLSPWLLLIPAAVIVLLVGAFFFLKTSDDPQPVAAPSASPSKSRPVSEPSKSQTGSTNSNSGSSSSGSSGSGSSGVAAPAQPTPKVWTPPPHQSHQKPANASVIKLDKSTWDGTMNGGRYEYTMNISEGSGGSLSAVMYRRNAKTGKDGYQTLTGSISGDTVTLNGQSWQNAPRSWTTDQITVKVSEGEATRVMQGTYTCTGCKGSSDIKGYQDFS